LDYIKDLDASHAIASYVLNEGKSELPEYILSAFAGFSNLVLTIKTKEEKKFFYQSNCRSSKYLVEQKNIAELLELIPSKKTALKFIVEHFNPTFVLNDIKEISEDSVITLLKENNFPSFYNSEISQLLNQIQKSLKYEGLNFVLTGKWKDLIEVASANQDMFQDVGYFLEEANIEHVANFLNAQSDADKLWEIILFNINEFSEKKYTRENLIQAEKNFIPTGTILQLTVEHLKQIGKTVNIPLDIEPVLQWGAGPKEPEARKKWIPEEEMWTPAINPNLYEVYFFQEFSNEVNLHNPSSKVLVDFKNALAKTINFAEKNESIFIEAFKLSQWIMERSQSFFIRSEKISELHTEALQKSGFSEQAQSIYTSQLNDIILMTGPFINDLQLQYY
jgi:hypothetical protein